MSDIYFAVTNSGGQRVFISRDKVAAVKAHGQALCHIFLTGVDEPFVVSGSAESVIDLLQVVVANPG